MQSQTFHTDADSLLSSIMLPPLSITIDGQQRQVRDLVTADILRLASIEQGKTSAGVEQYRPDTMDRINAVRKATAELFVDPPDTSTWNEAKLSLIIGLVMNDWKGRAEKNSASISASIDAEMGKRFGTPGNSTPPSSPSPQP